MTHSMTGFATAKGQFGAWSWVWDLRSVNGRGLDLRLKLPDWVEGLEPLVRKAVGEAVTRGSVTLGLRLTREAESAGLALNRAALERVLSLMAEVDHSAQARGMELRHSSAVEILGLRGVLEAGVEDEDLAPLRAALLADLPGLLAAFTEMRAHEGAALAALIERQLGEIEALVAAAQAAVEARRAAQEEGLRAALAKVLDALDGQIDEARVAQELALIAVKSDVREELDRLTAHVGQARALLAGSEARGRKLDFLTQEFNREANTLCSKAGFAELTRIGLDLKAVVDQMREQVQNIE